MFLMGDFTIDHLNFHTTQHINEFIDNIMSPSLQPQILQPTRIHKNHKTLIDNIFCNILNLELSKLQYHNNFMRSPSTILFNT